MPFMDLIKKAIFEEEPRRRSNLPSQRLPSDGAAPRAAPATSPWGRATTSFYTRLAKQTDLSAVPELAKIEAFAAPLASSSRIKL